MTNFSEPDQHAPGEQVGVSALLDALTDTVERARSMPMSSSVLINRNEVLDLLDALRQGLPTQLTRADEVLSDAGQVYEEAQEQADRIIEQAERQAQMMVSQQEVIRAAQREAEQIVETARANAARLTANADDYCDRRLADFEIDLGKLVAQVQAGRNKLAERLDESGEAGQNQR